jgi:uncharacterized protein (DUF2461 family)
MPATDKIPGPFAGFSPNCIAFLRDLAASNDRDWYQAKRGRFESSCLKPATSTAFQK